MRVDLDAKVRTRDGQDVGSVHRAVVDPDKNEITHFVISTGGLLGRDILVPREQVEDATSDGEAIRLNLSKDELEDMPDFVAADYAVPPAGWVPPAYGYPAMGYLWPAAYAPGAYGAYGAYGAADAGEQGEYTPTVNKGARVLDRDGDELGVVDDVQYDPGSGRLRGLVVRVGNAFLTLFGGGKTIAITGEMVERVDQGVVRLRGDKDEIKRAHGK